MRLIFFGIFWLVSLVHLYGSFRDDRHLRNMTKGCILISLIGYYSAGASPVDYLVVTALLFSLVGDIVLIFPGGFVYGGVSFMLSQLFFILAYLPDVNFSLVPVWVYALVPPVYGAAIFFVQRELKAHIPKKLFVPMTWYLMCNAAMNVFACMRLISVPSLSTAVTLAGACLFFLSDCILFVVRFHKTKSVWRNHFLVMLTYILGEFLIIHGLMMLAG